MLVWDGFKESGDNFVKNTIVGATLWEDLYEKHTIKGYQYFKTEVKDFTADFAMPEGLDIEGLGFDGMQALLKKAMDTVPAEYKRIFGKQDKDGIYEDASYDKQSMKSETYKKQITRYDSVAQKYVDDTVEKTRKVRDTQGIKEDEYQDYLEELKALTDDQKSDKEYSSRVLVKNNGLFNEWVGTAPVMKKDADSDVSIEDYRKNVRYEGFGETDRLMGMFIQHKMIEGAGKAAANAPFYSKKLWNDNGSWFAAPSIRSVVDIAVTVAVAAATGPGAIGIGPLLTSAGLNMIDDLVFTTLDVANGMDAADAFSALGKKAAVSVATSMIGAKFNGTMQMAEGASKATLAGGIAQWKNGLIGDSLLGSTLLKGTEIMTTNVTSSLINALDFKAMFSGEDFFNAKGFKKSAFGKEAMAGVLSGMAGNFVMKGMPDYLKSTSFGNLKTHQLNNISNIFGGLASTAVTYKMTDRASVNIINTSMFGLHNGDDPVRVGLYEIGFGEGGPKGSFSMGGTDMNLGSIASALCDIQTSLRESLADNPSSYMSSLFSTSSDKVKKAGRDAFAEYAVDTNLLGLSQDEMNRPLKEFGEKLKMDFKETEQIEGKNVDFFGLPLPGGLLDVIATGTTNILVAGFNGFVDSVVGFNVLGELKDNFLGLIKKPDMFTGSYSAEAEMFNNEINFGAPRREKKYEIKFNDPLTVPKRVDDDTGDQDRIDTKKNEESLANNKMHISYNTGFSVIANFDFNNMIDTGKPINVFTNQALGGQASYVLTSNALFGKMIIGIEGLVSMAKPSKILAGFSYTNSAQKLSMYVNFTKFNTVISTSLFLPSNAMKCSLQWEHIFK